MLLSGVVRNRKVHAASIVQEPVASEDHAAGALLAPGTLRQTVWDAMCGKFFLRAHKFTFEWELAFHLIICMVSLAPFALSGDPRWMALPMSVWGFYNVLFLIGTKRASLLLPGFDKFKRRFKAAAEEFLPAKLLPVLSLSFALVVASLALTAHHIDGPPLCFSSCGSCLRRWKKAIPRPPSEDVIPAEEDLGCGYDNGREMLGYYTIAMSGFLPWLAVIIGLMTCMAWRVAKEELDARQEAEAWLKHEDPAAFHMREEVMNTYSRPGTPVRPESNLAWVLFGLTAAITFTLLGWKNWGDIPPSRDSTALIIMNVMMFFVCTFILHLGFYGRLIALYQRNFHRIQHLTKVLGRMTDLETWWNARSFILNEDLALDYDIGGLAVSATFFLVLTTFIVTIVQMCREGFRAVRTPPASFTGYASVYLTMCLIRIFTLATNTFNEQHRHIESLQRLNRHLIARPPSMMVMEHTAHSPGDDPALNPPPKHMASTAAAAPASKSEAMKGPTFFIEGDLPPLEEPAAVAKPLLKRGFSSSNHLGKASYTPRSQRKSVNSFQALEANTALEGVTTVDEEEDADGASRRRRTFSMSGSSPEAERQSIADMIQQIRDYDPYPVIFGIPVMPSLFTTSKLYIFVCFVVIGSKVAIDVLRTV